MTTPVALIILLLGAATISAPAIAREQGPTPAPTADTPTKKPARIDLKHLPHVGSDYYPKESVRHGEQGICLLALFIKADGSVPAAQLLTSTGYPDLDKACIESLIHVTMIPATLNGAPVDGWTELPEVWKITGAPPLPPPSATKKTDVPHVADNYELQVGQKFYPEPARAKHQRGYCVVHTTVGSRGTALGAQITRSTGSAILDQACLAAITAARFNPERKDGSAVADSADIAIYW